MQTITGHFLSKLLHQYTSVLASSLFNPILTTFLIHSSESEIIIGMDDET
jgi:hypothetical protein